jgi:hypothetical protein
MSQHECGPDPGAGMIKLSEYQARARAAADEKATELLLDRMPPLRVELRGQNILITLPGTSFRVVYPKPARGRLAAMPVYPPQSKRSALFTRLQFLARARKLANERARELGWIP